MLLVVPVDDEECFRQVILNLGDKVRIECPLDDVFFLDVLGKLDFLDKIVLVAKNRGVVPTLLEDIDYSLHVFREKEYR